MLPREAYDIFMERRRTLLTRFLALVLGGLQPGPSWALALKRPSVRVLTKHPLVERLAGLEATAVEVTYPPGAASDAHRHPGFVLGYVLEGRLRFAVNGEPERVLEPGEMFYEPSGSVHSVSANALSDRQTKILAFMVAPTGEPIVQAR